MKKLDHYLGNIGKVLSATFKGLGSVIRTQLLLSLLTFIILCIGLAILDISYWGLIAFAIALVDLIPLLILYIVIFIGRQVLEPVMNGKSIGIKPLYTFLATILASIVFGAWGLVLGPVIAIIIKTVLDLKEGQNH